ncbi:MAG: sigma-54 interaction domain-containing protein [Planctomycetota bacterium]
MELGPSRRAAGDRRPDRLVLLANDSLDDRARFDRYARWLRDDLDLEVDLWPSELDDPSAHRAVLDAAGRAVEEVTRDAPDSALEFLLSSGTPAMHAAWILLSKSRYRATLLKCSIERGTEVVDLPLTVSLDFAKDFELHPDEKVLRLIQALPPESPEFEAIQGESPSMVHAKTQARRLAPRDLPVLVLGESGTGKELFARAIHAESRRYDQAFKTVNCGAIPKELVDSQLFGHAKGSFTGATSDREGHFEAANGGTLFLDEIGDLPLDAQVRLLRTLQEGEVLRVGETTPRKVDVRVIAATHVDLFAAVGRGEFRRDLAYRLAVGIVRLPSLRDRGDDFAPLVRTLQEEVDQELRTQPDFSPRPISARALGRLRQHRWPGNVRELKSTLVRASLFATGSSISASDIEEALLPTMIDSGNDDILERPLGDGFDVREPLSQLKKHYVRRAMEQSKDSKRKAAELLGLPPQTFRNWLGVEVRHGE